MQPILQALAILVSLAILVGTIELVRRGLLRSEYSILWLMSAVLLLAMSIFKGTLDTLADLLGVGYAPSLLFMAALACLVIIQISQNITMSNLSSKNRDLAQELSILQWHSRQVENGEGQNGFVRLAVYEMIARLNATTGWDQLVQQMLEKVVQLVGADAASLVLFDEERGDLYIEAATHLSPNIVSETRLKLGEGVVGWVAQQREAVLLNGRVNPGRFIKFVPKSNLIGSSISVPLMSSITPGQPACVFGVLNVGREPNAPPLRPSELGLVIALSVLVSPILQNAKVRQYRESENRSISLPDPALRMI